MGASSSPEREARKQRRILMAALLLMLAANLRTGYAVTVAGETLPGRYGKGQTERCLDLARETAEEILGDSAAVKPPELRLRLGFSRGEGDEALLADALLRATEGITVSQEVLVNGDRLGTVQDGEALRRALERSIRSQMPLAAVSGSISGRISLRPVYTREGGDTSLSDMVLLITGRAPVVYVDKNGKLA